MTCKRDKLKKEFICAVLFQERVEGAFHDIVAHILKPEEDEFAPPGPDETNYNRLRLHSTIYYKWSDLQANEEKTMTELLSYVRQELSMFKKSLYMTNRSVRAHFKPLFAKYGVRLTSIEWILKNVPESTYVGTPDPTVDLWIHKFILAHFWAYSKLRVRKRMLHTI